jgi:chromosome partitioning protein
MFDSRVSLGQQVREELSKYFGDRMFKTAIPRAVRLAEAPGHGKSILHYDPRSKGSQAYLSFTGEILSRRGWDVVRLD